VSQNVYVSTHHLPEVVSDDHQVPVYQVFTLAYEAEGDEPAGRLRVKLPLLGSHQQVNAAIALSVLRALSPHGIQIDRETIARGFANVSWPARLEIVRRDPIVVVDGAHNADSMSKLSQAMYDLFYGRKLIVVLGTLRDKDIAGMVAELAPGPGSMIGPGVQKVIVTRSRHPRSAYPSDVAAVARARGLFVEVRENVAEALATAVSIARAAKNDGDGEPVVLVTGSLSMAAEALQHYGRAPDLSEEDS
jgi:dihydrofolate synthase/folylpolyglutamate synthase